MTKEKNLNGAIRKNKIKVIHGTFVEEPKCKICNADLAHEWLNGDYTLLMCDKKECFDELSKASLDEMMESKENNIFPAQVLNKRVVWCHSKNIFINQSNDTELVWISEVIENHVIDDGMVSAVGDVFISKEGKSYFHFKEFKKDIYGALEKFNHTSILNQLIGQSF